MALALRVAENPQQHIQRIHHHPPRPDPLHVSAHNRQQALNVEIAGRDFLPIQPGDVPATCADVDDLMRDVGFSPSTSIEEGIRSFVGWYREYYGV